MRRRDLATTFLLALITFSVPARALKTEVYGRTPLVQGSEPILVTAGQAIVQVASGAATSSIDGALAAIGASRGADIGSGWVVVNWNDGAPVAQRVSILKSMAGISKVQPSHVYSLRQRVPSDPLVSSQYALSQVNAYGAWTYETGTSSRVTIAIIDSGVDGTQSDLIDKFQYSTSVAFNPNTGAVAVPNNPLHPACYHATHVAGVAAASSDNGSLVAGMSWGAKLVSLKIFLDADCDTNCCSAAGDCSEFGNTCLTNDAGIAAAINYATGVANTAAYGHIVINMSIGGGPVSDCATDSPAVQAAINAANAKNIVVVAAAGNSGGPVENPGFCTNVIPMGATDINNNVAAFSSRGSALASGGLVAPGVALLTTEVGGNTTSATGTSFASPMGAGLAALILSARPTLTPTQVQTYMRAGAEDIGQPSSVQGAGRMNAFRSVRLAVKGTLSDFDGEQKPIAFPNPFRVSQNSLVSFAVPPSIQGAGLKLKIYTVDGAIVRELGTPSWDGKNADGTPVASGAYVFVVSTSKGTSRGRMTVIR